MTSLAPDLTLQKAAAEQGISLPPTQADLPHSDGEPTESQRHQFQMELLINTLLPWLDARDNGYVGGNMFLYYSLEQVRQRDFKGPDVFVALNVPKGERLSWVCWEEGKTPDVIIELLSASTATADKGKKKDIYATQLHVPEYFWFDPYNPDDWAGFRLQGSAYVPIAPEDSRFEVQSLELCLMQWYGTFKGIEATWLRWATSDGALLLTAEERERQQAEQERQRAEQAESQIQQIVRNLFKSGMATEQVATVTGLTLDRVNQYLE
ncbi:MAG: Uma2 family endonuclease [Elainellaceae cyanobacterium]